MRFEVGDEVYARNSAARWRVTDVNHSGRIMSIRRLDDDGQMMAQEIDTSFVDGFGFELVCVRDLADAVFAARCERATPGLKAITRSDVKTT